MNLTSVTQPRRDFRVGPRCVWLSPLPLAVCHIGLVFTFVALVWFYSHHAGDETDSERELLTVPNICR